MKVYFEFIGQIIRRQVDTKYLPQINSRIIINGDGYDVVNIKFDYDNSIITIFLSI